MQISANSEIAKRIEDSSSTPVRKAREADGMRRRSDMGSRGWIRTAREGENKKAGPSARWPRPVGGCRWRLARAGGAKRMGKKYGKKSGQTGNVIGHRLDLLVIELGRHLGHRQAAGAPAVAEQIQLRHR